MRARYIASLRLPTAGGQLPAGLITGESTPSYMLYGRPVLQRIKTLYTVARHGGGGGVTVVPPKLLVILRDPVKRAYSHYQMTAAPTDRPLLAARRQLVAGMSFEDLVAADMQLLQAAGVAAPPPLPPCGGAADSNGGVGGEPAGEAAAAGEDSEADWVGRFEREYAGRLPADHGSHSYVGRGLYWPQLVQVFNEFGRERVLVLTLEELGGKVEGSGTTAEVMQRVFAWLGLPAGTVIEDTAPKNVRDYSAAPINPEVQQQLRQFYAPFNARLYELLGRDLGWGAD
eukprot:SAG22_NODE_5033_length_1103_cov_1.236056_1_plen_286_part_00